MGVLSGILVCAAIWEGHLFAAPGHEPDGSLGPQAEALEHSKCFKAHHYSAAVVIRSSLASNIPGVAMASEDQYFVRPLRACYLSNQVVASRFVPFALEVEMHGDELASIGHALEHLGVLNADGCCRYERQR